MSPTDQLGTALASAGIVLLGCFVAGGLLLIHLALAVFNRGRTRARDFGRLAMAWGIVSAIILVAGLVLQGTSKGIEPVQVLLTFGVPAIGVGMSLLASRSAGRAKSSGERSAER
jgi:hypothetical protein